jgi:predicted lipoprotein with Yx(FWY)xxD motif
MEKRMMRIATGLAALVLLSTAALAAPAMEGDTAKGKVLVDEKGMTLYIFDKDEPNKSNCYDQCAVNWPPLLVKEGETAEGDWTIVERTDGTRMWAYKGKPLYLWIKDTRPGDITGDGVGGVWHLATP